MVRERVMMAVLVSVVRKMSQSRHHTCSNMNAELEPAMQKHSRTFQVEGMANAKTLRWERARGFCWKDL